MCRILKGGASGKITRIKTSSGKKGKLSNAATSNPMEIDAELQKTLSAITAGNLSDRQAARAGQAFIDKYKDYFKFQAEAPASPINADKL